MSDQLAISAAFSALTMTLYAVFAPQIAAAPPAPPMAPEIRAAETGVTAPELSFQPERVTPILR